MSVEVSNCLHCGEKFLIFIKGVKFCSGKCEIEAHKPKEKRK